MQLFFDLLRLRKKEDGLFVCPENSHSDPQITPWAKLFSCALLLPSSAMQTDVLIEMGCASFTRVSGAFGQNSPTIFVGKHGVGVVSLSVSDNS